MDPEVREGVGLNMNEIEVLKDPSTMLIKVSSLNKALSPQGDPEEGTGHLEAEDLLQIHAFSCANSVSWVSSLSEFLLFFCKSPINSWAVVVQAFNPCTPGRGWLISVSSRPV